MSIDRIESVQQLRSLLEINNAVVSQLDLRELLKVISPCLRQVIPHDAALLTLHDPENAQLRLHALDLQMFGKVPFEEGVLISLEDTPEGQAITSRRPVLVGPVVDLERFSSPWVRHAVDNGVRSGCAVPLISHDRTLGALSVVSLSEDAFTEEDAELLTQIGCQIAIAVENALNFERARQAERQAAKERSRSELLLNINNAVVSHLDLDTLVKTISATLLEILPHDAAGIALYDAERDHLREYVNIAYPGFGGYPLGEIFPLAGTSAGLVFTSGKPLLLRRRDAERFPAERLPRPDENIPTSACLVPLISHGRKLGILGVGGNQEDSFTEDDLERLAQIAGQVAIAVENSINFERARAAEQKVRRQFERERLMLEINNAVVTQLDLRELIRVISSCLRETLQPDVTGISLYDPETNQFRAYMFDLPDNLPAIEEGTPMPLEGTVGGMAFISGRPFFMSRPDPEMSSSEFDRRLIEGGIRSGGVVPLIAHDRKLGFLGVGSFREDAFSEADQELLCHIANQIAIAVENALAYREIETLKNKLAEEKLYLEEEIHTVYNFEEIIGNSPALKRILKQVETVAPTDSTVLIQGETGTGKELIARAIHSLSRRRERTLVKLNCAAIPMGLIESELFGHEKGSFTGAIAQRIGRFELADKGTMFLDEVGEIPLELQPKLLRVLQEREFERLGNARTLRSDVRLIAATNRDLAQMAAENRFRSDLYYRLNVFPITIPPLRERREDIPMLLRFFANKFAGLMKKHIKTIPADAVAALQNYRWPGNIRELENMVERAVILTQGEELQIPLSEIDVPAKPTVAAPHSTPSSASSAAPAAPKSSDSSSLEAVEREHILRVLAETDWVVSGPSGAAARLGMKRTTLQARMKKLGISRRR